MPAPVGKARLSQEVVAEHQRQRALSAAVGVFAERGYRSTTVDDLVGSAQIGVGSFYSLFGGKEDCFLRLYDRIVAEARERIVAAAGDGTPWAARVRAGLRELLLIAATEPDRARIVIVEATAAGPVAERRYAETTAELTAVIREGRSVEGSGGDGPPRSFEDAAVAGLAWVLHQRLAAGEPIVVDELLPEMEGLFVA
jgi:AcrR family transcriptional regulator